MDRDSQCDQDMLCRSKHTQQVGWDTGDRKGIGMSISSELGFKCQAQAVDFVL